MRGGSKAYGGDTFHRGPARPDKRSQPVPGPGCYEGVHDLTYYPARNPPLTVRANTADREARRAAETAERAEHARKEASKREATQPLRRHWPGQSALAFAGGEVNTVKAPSAKIGIQRGGPDVHDHTASVADHLKRMQLQEVRDDRARQGYYNAQFASRDRPPPAAPAVDTSLASSARRGEDDGATGQKIPACSNLIREVVAATVCVDQDSFLEPLIPCFASENVPGLRLGPDRACRTKRRCSPSGRTTTTSAARSGSSPYTVHRRCRRMTRAALRRAACGWPSSRRCSPATGTSRASIWCAACRHAAVFLALRFAVLPSTLHVPALTRRAADSVCARARWQNTSSTPGNIDCIFTHQGLPWLRASSQLDPMLRSTEDRTIMQSK